MTTKLIIEWESDKKTARPRDDKRFWSFAAEFLLLLADGKWHVIGHDFTPPPFREKLEKYFQTSGVKYLSRPEGISFEFTTPAQIAGCVEVINWTCALVVRLEEDGLDQARVPMMRRGLVLRTPDAWYEEHEHEFTALCYLGISPNPAVDLRTSSFGQEELLNTSAKALGSNRLQPSETEIKATVMPRITGGDA